MSIRLSTPPNKMNKIVVLAFQPDCAFRRAGVDKVSAGSPKGASGLEGHIVSSHIRGGVESAQLRTERAIRKLGERECGKSDTGRASRPAS